MSKYAIQVKDVRKRFSYTSHKNNSIKRAITQIFKPKDTSKESFYALDGVSFNVEKGDFFGILGRNGSGKSTLLKIISEIYQPTTGSVTHEGKIVSFIELGVGFKSELTGRENVYLNAALLGFSKSEIDAMYDDIVSFAELADFMDQQLKNYSSGMKVRLAFSVAIRAKADILILDEVLAVGDADFQKKCTDYFETLKNDGKTVVLVTHSMANVRKFCNKAVVIDGGEIIYNGTADEAADEYLSLFRKSRHEEGLKKSSQLDMPRNVTIEDVSLDSNSSEIKCKLRLKNHTNIIEDVCVAIDVYKNGKILIGSFEKLFFQIQDNELISKELAIANVLGSGEFSLNVGVRRKGGGGFDTKRNVCHFSNTSTYDSKGVFPVIFHLKEGE